MLQGNINTRWMIPHDMPEVMEIEDNNPRWRRWTAVDFNGFREMKNNSGIVAEDVNQGRKIVGYLMYELHRTRFHVANLCVRDSRRREGIGSKLHFALESRLVRSKSHGRDRIVAEVAESNLDCLLFLRAVGYRAERVLHDYFEGCEDDAISMVFRVGNVSGKDRELFQAIMREEK